MRLPTGLVILILQLLNWPPVEAGQWPEEPPRAEPDAGTLALLRNGDVLVENIRLDEMGGAARVQALFQGTAESVWALLESCAANYRFIEGLLDCEVLESADTHALTRHALKKNMLTPRMEYMFETVREPYRWIAIRLLSGDLDIMEGNWRFDPLDDGTFLLVTHRIRVQPRIPVPRWLVRRTLRNDLGDMVACMRAMVGASGNEENHRLDLDRCPEGRVER